MKPELIMEKAENRLEELAHCLIEKREAIPWWWSKPGPLTDDPRLGRLSDSKRLALGDKWQGHEGVAWMWGTVFIPSTWQPLRETVWLGLQVGREALVYKEGDPWESIAPGRDVIRLSEPGHNQTAWFLSIEISDPPDGWDVPRQSQRLSRSEIFTVNRERWQVYHLLKWALDSVKAIESDDLRRWMLHYIDRTLEQLTFHNGQGIDVGQAFAMLSQWGSDGHQRFGKNGQLVALGHAHIDYAWLWPISETRRKIARSFANVLRLFEEEERFVFGHSSPAMYEVVAQDHPALFRQIVQRVQEGRWEPLGAFWVESDCNLIGAESMVRHLLLTQQFYQTHLGTRAEIAWFPDTFGFNAIMPQILRQGGIRAFVTAKFSYNQSNRYPHNAFWWEGIDGTRIKSYLVLNPGSDYNGEMTPEDLRRCWSQSTDNVERSTALYPFGWGDGGGGPDRLMLANAHAANRLPGTPSVKFGRVDRFLDEIDEHTFPVWKGDLYLERHRGTYTTQSWIKAANQQAERLLRRAELWSVVAATLKGMTYPADEFTKLWKQVLINQFHDILPGSSIRDVYDQARRDYDHIRRSAADIQCQSLQALMEDDTNCSPLAASSQPDRAGALWVFNSLASPRAHELIRLPNELENAGFLGDDGRLLPSQKVVDESGRSATWVRVNDIPSVGWTHYEIIDNPSSASMPDPSPFYLTTSSQGAENTWVRIAFGPGLTITSYFDKRLNRELITPGSALNQIRAFEDWPIASEAWDIDAYYLQHEQPVDWQPWHWVVQGPLWSRAQATVRVHNAPLLVSATVYAHRPQIDIDITGHWTGHRILLKAWFPLLLKSQHIKIGNGLGFLERPWNHNTSWEQSRFEVPVHSWAAVSEGNTTFALLTGSKFGLGIHDQALSLSLLKSPTYPDPTSDQGEFHARYSVQFLTQSNPLPDIIDQAACFEEPLVTVVSATHRAGIPGRASFLSLAPEKSGITLQSLKQSEDRKAIIVRLAEHAGSTHPNVTMKWLKAPKNCVATNLLEEPQQEAANIIKPFQLRSYRCN
jgi:alpha-mannosidase